MGASRLPKPIRVAIVGVGNCASSLVQGVHYYRDADPAERVPGLMHVELAGYHVGDLEFVAAFDVDAKKVGRDLAEAIVAPPNNTVQFAEVPPLGAAALLGGDELVEPPHFPLGGLEPVPLEFEPVGVEPLGGARERLPDPLAALFDPAAPGFEDAQAGGRVGAGEEREVHPEQGLVGGLGSGLGHELGEVLFALGCEPVDLAGPPAGQQRFFNGPLDRGLLDDESALTHPLEGGVEGAVAERGPDGPEQGQQAFAQLVAVHGGLVQEPQYGQLKHLVPPLTRRSNKAMYRSDTSE